MIKKFFSDETGLELSEYAVAAALIAVGAVLAFAALGDTIQEVMTDLNTSITENRD